jgi:hypothetical protein
LLTNRNIITEGLLLREQVNEASCIWKHMQEQVQKVVGYKGKTREHDEIFVGNNGAKKQFLKEHRKTVPALKDPHYLREIFCLSLFTPSNQRVAESNLIC